MDHIFIILPVVYVDVEGGLERRLLAVALKFGFRALCEDSIVESVALIQLSRPEE